MSDSGPSIGEILRRAERARRQRRAPLESFPTSTAGVLRVPYPSGIQNPGFTAGGEGDISVGPSAIGELVRMPVHGHLSPGGEPLVWGMPFQQVGFQGAKLPDVGLRLPHTAVYGIEGDFSWTDGFLGGGRVSLLLNGIGIPGLSPIRTGLGPEHNLGRTFTLAQEFVANAGDRLSIQMNFTDPAGGHHDLSGVVEVGVKEPVRQRVLPDLSGPGTPYMYGQNAFNTGTRHRGGVRRSFMKDGDLLVAMGHYGATGSGASVSNVTPRAGWTFLSMRSGGNWVSVIAVKRMTKAMEVSSDTYESVINITNGGSGGSVGIFGHMAIHNYPGGSRVKVTGHAAASPGTPDFERTLGAGGIGILTSQVHHTNVSTGNDPGPLGVSGWPIIRSGADDNLSGVNRCTIQRTMSPSGPKVAFAVGGGTTGFTRVTSAGIWRVS
jgi:hypothetical protein